MIVLRLALSRTETTPCVTRTSVVVQVSWTSHFVPRTVAAAYEPLVRNLPLPSPHSLRDFGLRFWAARALREQSSGSLSVSSVIAPPA